jgi:amino acid transporter
VKNHRNLLVVRYSLKSRHIQFIALGGTIGTGLFLGIGSAFTRAGPLSVLLGYSFTGIAIFAMMQCLGEMATWLPLPGSIPQFCARYVDDALGFAVGWNVSHLNPRRMSSSGKIQIGFSTARECRS